MLSINAALPFAQAQREVKSITKLKKLKEVTNSGKRRRKKIAASKTL